MGLTACRQTSQAAVKNGSSSNVAPTAPTSRGDVASDGALAPEASPAVVVLPSHESTDDLVGQMLSILLRRRKTPATFVPARLLVSERLEKIEKLAPRIVCISALPPYATVHARQTAKRVCARFPELQLVVGYWDEAASPQDIKHRVFYSQNGTLVNSLRTQAVPIQRL